MTESELRLKLSSLLKKRGVDEHSAVVVSMRTRRLGDGEKMLAWLEENKNATVAEICEKAREIDRISKGDEMQASVEKLLGEGDYRALTNMQALLIVYLRGWISEKDTILQIVTALETDEQVSSFHRWLKKNYLAKPETLLQKVEEIRAR